VGFFSPEPAYNNPVMIDMKNGAMTPVERRYDLERLAWLESENAALKVQLAGRDARIATLESQITELLAKMNTLSEQVARLSKNASNSSKPPVERHRQTAQIRSAFRDSKSRWTARSSRGESPTPAAGTHR